MCLAKGPSGTVYSINYIFPPAAHHSTVVPASCRSTSSLVNTSRRATYISPLPSNHFTSQTQHQSLFSSFEPPHNSPPTSQLIPATNHQNVRAQLQVQHHHDLRRLLRRRRARAEEARWQVKSFMRYSSRGLPTCSRHLTNTSPSQVSKNSTSPSTPRPLPSRPTRASTTAPSSRRSRRPARPSTLARLMALLRPCRWARRSRRRNKVACAREGLTVASPEQEL